MKKVKHNNSFTKKTTKIADNKEPTENKEPTTNKANSDPLDDENQGFGGWLRSDDGLDTMKLFVIANSILLLTTLVIPHLKTAIEIVGEMVYGVEESYD